MSDFARQPVNRNSYVYYPVGVSMSDFARQPVNFHWGFFIFKQFLFQLANLPDSLSTGSIVVGDAPKRVSIGEFARQPVNEEVKKQCLQSFNWRICPTACQQNWSSKTSENVVSIGEFARQPVNFIIAIMLSIIMFQLANLPDSLSTKHTASTGFVSRFQLANLPDSLSTLDEKFLL